MMMMMMMMMRMAVVMMMLMMVLSILRIVTCDRVEAPKADGAHATFGESARRTWFVFLRHGTPKPRDGLRCPQGLNLWLLRCQGVRARGTWLELRGHGTPKPRA